MYRILTASKDTYITNKIVNNRFRATDANVGKSATIDIFKLYGESTSGSDTSPIEVSRGLIKFDLGPLRKMTGSMLDISHESFKCTLFLKDVYGGQTCPSNFKIIVFPLSKSFDEGIGRDVVNFSDLDSSNWLTSSISNSTTPVTWSGAASSNPTSPSPNAGAGKQGLLGSSNIDIISSGNLNDGNGIVNLWKEQLFSTGEEDLEIDITSIISGTLKGLIPDQGFRISYSGSQETDKVTRFVKRFGSSQNSIFKNKPKLVVQFNDTVQDHHQSFYFNLSGSLFLNNYHRGSLKNIISGSSLSIVKGSDSILLKLISGSSSRGTYYEKIITGSQHSIGENFVEGVYSASFAISEFSSSNKGETRTGDSLRNEIKNAGSATFTEIWSSLDETIGYITSSLVINSVNRTTFSNKSSRMTISITNMKTQYTATDKARFTVFAEDVDRKIVARKLPFETKSSILTSLYYRIRDIESNDIIIPFETSSNGTLCSTDSNGMYFEFFMSSLPKGKLHTIDFLLKEAGVNQIFTDVSSKFIVV